jgi:hypothetical protein
VLRFARAADRIVVNRAPVARNDPNRSLMKRPKRF